MNIDWRTPRHATALHAVLASRGGIPFVDAAIEQQAANRLPELSQPNLVNLAGAVACGVERPADLPAAMDAWPDPSDELAYRIRPLREQWEARGSGLLRQLQQFTDTRTLPSSATVALVLPVIGGHGVALPQHSAVLLEAVLANPHPQLPEVVRLAWLLSRLVARDEFHVAVLPAILSAAAEVELLVADERTLSTALIAWRVEVDQEQATRLAERLWRWWSVYRDSSQTWAEAVNAWAVDQGNLSSGL